MHRLRFPVPTRSAIGLCVVRIQDYRSKAPPTLRGTWWPDHFDFEGRQFGCSLQSKPRGSWGALWMVGVVLSSAWSSRSGTQISQSCLVARSPVRIVVGASSSSLGIVQCLELDAPTTI